MECIDVYTLSSFSHDAFFKVIYGCIGERQCKDLFWQGLTRLEKVFHKTYYGGRLSCSSTSNHKSRPNIVGDGSKLLFIKIVTLDWVNALSNLHRFKAGKILVVFGKTFRIIVIYPAEGIKIRLQLLIDETHCR